MQAPPKFRRGEQIHALMGISAACTLFRTHQGHDFVSVPDGALAHTAYPLKSPALRRWFINRFYNETTTAPSAHALNSALQILHAKIQFASVTEAAAGRRLIPGDNSIILDLAGSGARCVEILPQGWTVTGTLPFAFERATGTGALPAPATHSAGPAHLPDPESLDRLRALLNIPAGGPWIRVLTWLAAALRPEGPYPILILHGASGAGKSTTARLLRTLLDPVQMPLQALPSTPGQLELAAARQRILAFDDVDHIPRSVLAPLAKIADESAPVILTLASHFAGNLPDSIERRGLMLPLTQPDQLRTLYAIRLQFELLHPLALAALCTAASTALQRFDSVAAAVFPRLADATAWACAAAPALALTETDILAAISSIVIVPKPEPLVIGTARRQAASGSASMRQSRAPSKADRRPASASGVEPDLH